MRAGSAARLEDADEILGEVDVERHERIVDHDRVEAGGSRPAEHDGSTAGHAERGLDGVGRTQRKGVRAPVLRWAERNRPRGRAELVDGVGAHERAIGHDDDRARRRAPREDPRDRERVPMAGIVDRLGAFGGERPVGRHDEDTVDPPSAVARVDHVSEHRSHELGALIRREQGLEPPLRRNRRIRWNDGQHRTMSIRVAILCGGLGGSRLVDAVAQAAGPAAVTAVGNVGDDLEILGLHVSPDVDTVLYTLARLLDEGRGWGVRDESYGALVQVGRLGGDTWFTLGDRDVGLHLVRTERLRAGEPLSAVLAQLAAALGVDVRILPATDDPVRTMIETDDGELDFQTWFVGRRHADPVRGVRYAGVESTRPAPGVLAAIGEADAVLIAPSNPFVSILPILAVPGIEDAVRRHPLVAAVSPLVGGKAIRGPLAGMMDTLGHPPGAVGVARLYAELADVFVLDRVDEALADDVAGLGLRPVVCDTIMVEPGARRDVGSQVLAGVLG